MRLAFLDGLLISQAFTDPVFFFSVIATVVASVTLHELGHAYAAIAQGDPTPRLAGRLTLDPLVHMGPTSLLVLVLVGIAWGQTPVDPTRFRSRYGDALVSFAGPLVNLVLAGLGLTALGLWLRSGGTADGPVAQNVQTFLFLFGMWNLVL
ncbi:MAG: site-2 protease family protein, partial [Planctomycetota bacterium]